MAGNHTKNSADIDVSQAQPQPVLLVQSSAALEQVSGVSLLDIWLVFVKKITWFVVIVVLVFLACLGLFYKSGQKVTYQQLISVPTFLDSKSFTRKSLFPIKDLVNGFQSQYVMFWQNGSKYYLNDTFSYTNVLGAMRAPGQPYQTSASTLLLSIKAPTTYSKQVKSLFTATTQALQAIVNEKMMAWKMAMGAKVNVELLTIRSLQKSLSVAQSQQHSVGQADGMASARALVITHLQGKLLTAQKQLAKDRWTASNVKARVKPASSLLVSKPTSIVSILIKSVWIALVLGFFFTFFISFLVAAKRYYQKKIK